MHLDGGFLFLSRRASVPWENVRYTLASNEIHLYMHEDILSNVNVILT